MDVANCPNCRMEQDSWPNPDGYERHGVTYCCEGCAKGAGCTCEQEEFRKEEVGVDEQV